jgi:hypothetical protein
MLTRTWPLGTTRACQIHEIHSQGLDAVIIALDDQDEGHVIIVSRADLDRTGLLRSGGRGRLVFTAGGPLGAYWRFESAAVKSGNP